MQVQLNGSAFNADGTVAANVSAAGSNRTKLRNGVATFRSVRVQAPGEGEYKLLIASATRKVAVQEATVTVKVSGWRGRLCVGLAAGASSQKLPRASRQYCTSMHGVCSHLQLVLNGSCELRQYIPGGRSTAKNNWPT